jgi:hypothetical protein
LLRDPSIQAKTYAIIVKALFKADFKNQAIDIVEQLQGDAKIPSLQMLIDLFTRYDQPTLALKYARMIADESDAQLLVTRALTRAVETWTQKEDYKRALKTARLLTDLPAHSHALGCMISLLIQQKRLNWAKIIAEKIPCAEQKKQSQEAIARAEKRMLEKLIPK